MERFGKHTRQGIQRLAEYLKELGTELKVTTGTQKQVKDDFNLGFRYAEEIHRLHISQPGGPEDAQVTLWTLTSRGYYNPAGKWASQANHTLSNGPSEFVIIIMSAFGIKDAPFPAVIEPKYSFLTKEKALSWSTTPWAVWHRSPDHGTYPQTYYFSEEAAYWTVARFRARALRKRLPFGWAIAPRREVSLTPEELEALAFEVGVNERPEACLFLTRNHLKRWVHPYERGICGW